MSKRRPDHQLTHENWDQDDEKEEKGTFTPVEDSVLQTRVIKRAKRTLDENEEYPSEKKKTTTPFAAFAGLSNLSSKPVFSFQKKEIPKETDTHVKTGFAATSFKSAADENTSKSGIALETSDKKAEDGNLAYFRQLRALNESVLTWLQLHINKNPCSDFTPVFDDYKKHLKKLEDTHFINKCASGGNMTPSVFKIPEKVSAHTETDLEKNSGFSVLNKNSGQSQKDDEMLYGAGFASNTTNTSTFSFRIKPALTATSPGSNSGPTASHSVNPKDENEAEFGDKETPQFCFGPPQKNSSERSESSALDSSKPFTFGVSSFLAGNHSSVAVEKEPDYEPPKNDFQAVAEEGALYSKRCKLYFKKGDQFVDKGVGMLYLKPLEQKTQLLIRADTNLGNILLNIVLSASLPISRKGKNHVLIVCVPNPPLDAKNADANDAIPMLLKVKTSDDADELLDNLNKYKS